MSVTHNWQNYALSVVLCVAIFLILQASQKLLRLRNIQKETKNFDVLVLTAIILVLLFFYFLYFSLTHALEPSHYFLTIGSFVTALFIRFATNSNYETAVNLSKSSALEHYYATHDDLTALPNLTFFNEQLEKTLSFSRREDDEFALLIIGLNRFKVINETLGYFVGDAILQEIAHRIRSVLRKSDLIARLGGDEFAVLINPVVAQGHIHTISKNIAESVQEPLAVEGKPADVGVSIGVSLYPKHARNSIELIEKARNALIVAEKRGDSVFIYDTEAAEDYIEDIQIIGMLQRAIQEEQFRVFYQPQVRLRDEKIISAEALIRWQHPAYGLLDPGRFIPYAEQAGLIYKINLWLLRKIVTLLSDWREKNIFVPIAFNITANGFLNKDFQLTLNSNLKNLPWLTKMLKIELTETSSIDNTDEIHLLMTKFKKQGVQFSLDDYGTKHASLEYLKKLPFDELKIDQSFMVNAVNDEDSRVIIQHANAIAQQLKLTTTAEGVESEEVLKIAKKYGINNGQGYYFSPAVDSAELEENFRE